jgi:catechol 2,3-dioxygenase-like lactoylglutathione lyase family enzyme
VQQVISERGCPCGSVRYRLAGDPRSRSACFCRSCRLAGGVASVAWFVVGTDQYTPLRGRLASFQSSPPVTRSFCGECGTPIAYRHLDAPDAIDLTTATSDDPECFAPTREIWPCNASPGPLPIPRSRTSPKSRPTIRCSLSRFALSAWFAMAAVTPIGDSRMRMSRLVPMLPVGSMNASIEFYRKLGFDVERKNDDWGWAMLRFDECRLMVDQSINRHPEAPRQSVLYLYPDDIVDYHQQLRRNGLDVPDLDVTFYGLTEFRIDDPDGNRLWIGQDRSAAA